MKNDLPGGKYIFEWGGLIANAGGMTRAMLKRADTFIKAGADVVILLSARGLEQLEAIEHYAQNGYPFISRDNFVVMEDFFGEKYSNNALRHSFMVFEMLKKLPVENRNSKKIYYENGDIVAIESENAEQNKREIEIISSSEKLKVWEKEVRCTVKEITTEQGVKKKIEKFFSKTGFCHTCIENTWDKNKWNVTSIKLLNENTRTVQSFKSLDELRQIFFSEYVRECEEKEIFVFCDPILDFWPGFQYMKDKSKNIYRIAVNHGAGFGGDRNWNSVINPRLKGLIEDVNVPEMDALILLTKQAIKDFSKRLGNRTLFYHVPNTVKMPEQISPFNMRDLRRAVYVGRYDEKQKQITHIIKAFAKAVEKYPDVELHIYGRGDDYEMYKNLIESLKIEKNIILEGFSNNVNDIYQKAAFSIAASPAEGFSLSLVESLSNGCPTVTYNFKYGPEDYIVHGVNGLICELNNIDQLAALICQMFSMDLEKLEKMSSDAKEMIQVYNENAYFDNWKKVLWKILEKKNASYITDFSFLINSQNIDSIKGEIGVFGQVVIDGKIEEKCINKVHLYIREYNNGKNDYRRIEIDAEWIKGECLSFAFCIPYVDRENCRWICIDFQDQFLHKELHLL